jgi:hypothetical protein
MEQHVNRQQSDDERAMHLIDALVSHDKAERTAALVRALSGATEAANAPDTLESGEEVK